MSWTLNTLMFSGAAEDIRAAIALTGTLERPVDFTVFRPPPPLSSEEQSEWQRRHWGCPGLAEQQRVRMPPRGQTGVTYHFITPQTPPVRWAAELALHLQVHHPDVHLDFRAANTTTRLGTHLQLSGRTFSSAGLSGPDFTAFARLNPDICPYEHLEFPPEAP